MEIKRIGSQPSAKGPADYLTGNVRIDEPFQGTEPARVGGATVTFEPGARTAWHTHPLGQTLIVVAGSGWVQRVGSDIQNIRPGDVVWFAPGEKLSPSNRLPCRPASQRWRYGSYRSSRLRHASAKAKA